MEVFDAQFLDTLRNVAVAIGLVYSPILFANGILDVMLKYRQWRRRDAP